MMRNMAGFEKWRATKFSSDANYCSKLVIKGVENRS
jgi:hypothetical protein